MVYVISKEGKPLMPCSNAIARILLKKGRAKVKMRTPFTIKLTYDTTGYVQKSIHGIDTGSSKAGSAAVSEGNVLYMAEVEVRNDIKKKMDRRRTYRRNRRSRKTRYREKRFNNRKNSIKTDRFSPTMRSKTDAHEKEIRFVRKILPISDTAIETGTFDPHLMKNPALKSEKVKRWGYQKGPNYGYANTKAKVLARDGYACRHCEKKGKLHVHHIMYRSMGGSDEEWNLITLCEDCHVRLHRGEFELKAGGKRKGTLNHAAQMNSIRKQLLRNHPEAVETFGYVTKENRQALGLKKTHYIDACVIASGGEPFTFKTDTVLRKKCVPKGDFQRTKGVRSEQPIPKGKIHGFRKFDKVSYMGNEYFIKGRMTSGYAVLMDIDGNKADFPDAPRGFRTPKLSNCRRIAARKSILVAEEKAIHPRA